MSTEVKTPANPSRSSTARVKNPLPVPTECCCCRQPVRIATHQEIYGRDYSDWPYMYYCDGCGAYVGLHPFTAIPLGTLANKATRDARKHCKKPFELLWRGGRMTRSEAYQWLARRLNIPPEECHFGWFDAERCQRARQLCDEKIREYSA